jgi:hypothetical protein
MKPKEVKLQDKLKKNNNRLICFNWPQHTWPQPGINRMYSRCIDCDWRTHGTSTSIEKSWTGYTLIGKFLEQSRIRLKKSFSHMQTPFNDFKKLQPSIRKCATNSNCDKKCLRILENGWKHLNNFNLSKKQKVVQSVQMESHSLWRV